MADMSFAWFAGIDWGSERHHACLVDLEGTIIAERECSHSGTGLAELADWLIQMTGAASEVIVAIEVPHGPVVDTLLDPTYDRQRVTTSCSMHKQFSFSVRPGQLFLHPDLPQ